MKKAIDWMVDNHVTVNLIMLFIIFAGFVSLIGLKEEVFPEVDLDTITVQVMYPGGAPDDVESSIVSKIEDAVSNVDGIEKITGSAAENIGSVVIEIKLGEDVKDIKDKVKSEIDRITTFPESAEKPTIVENVTKSQVIQVSLYGDIDENSLTNLSEEIKDDLINYPEISQVDISGIRNYEISIEISEDELRKYGLTISMISNAIRGGSLDLPGGKIKTDKGEILIRTKALGLRKRDYEDIVVYSSSNGVVLKLKDIATIKDHFEDADMVAKFDGKRAAMISIYRTGDERVLEIAKRVKKYVELKQKELPKGVKISLWKDRSKILKQRMELLYKNALIGLILVLVSLTLFLDVRLAIWVSLGIVISFFGSFIIMEFFDMSINMMSLFAFILVLGIVVDDAIVVGENVFSEREDGAPPVKASKMGTMKVAIPVTFAVLTTVAAFSPLLFVDGTMGKVMKVVPIVIISVILFSLFESILILPAHLSSIKEKSSFLVKPFSYISKKVDIGLTFFITKIFKPFLELSLKNRYLTLSVSLITLILSIALFRGGVIKFTFLPEIEGDNISAFIVMPKGSSILETDQVVKQLEEGAEKLKKDYDKNYPQYKGKAIKHINTTIGDTPGLRRGPRSKKALNYDPSVAEVVIELLSSEERNFSSLDAMNLWRKYSGAGDIAGVKYIYFNSSIMSAGDAINIRLSSSKFEHLDKAIVELKAFLSKFKGVSDIRDNFEEGKSELKLKLKPNSEIYNITLLQLAQQVRHSFYGDETFRIQRGDDEIKVMVRYKESERKSLSDIEEMMIKTSSGVEIPFKYIADVQYGRGFSTISRIDKKRVITLTASVDEKVANANNINKEMIKYVEQTLKPKYRGLSYSFGGAQEQQSKTLKSLLRGFIIALFIIYTLLAIPFKSYIQPFIIMLSIPFGAIGAILGHYFMGFNLSVMSAFGIVALSGVVVNDALVLIDFINIQHRDYKHNIYDSIVIGAQKRFRPILLTSITTFLGLTPMILETSLQAKFLIPMAISLGFGIIFATVITLIMIPSFLLILEDIKKFFRWLYVKENLVTTEEIREDKV